MSYIFTSESVSEGHPDKICDQISDAILDECLKSDPNSRVACETLIKNNTVVVAGEITSNANVDYEAVARKVVKDIGYIEDDLGFTSASFEFQNLISEQSKDIDDGISGDKFLGSGDQGIMFGYACKETKELMPLPITLAHKLMLKHSEVRKTQGLGLRPDAKSQVSIEYDSNYQPKRIDSIILSTQHSNDLNLKDLREIVKSQIIDTCLPKTLLDNETKYFINPAGRFVIGGPVGDCGLTGRKIIVDTYGGMARHGGGGFSGKDPSKVDRSAAYGLRHVAKSLVNSNFCDYCEIQASYAIGVSNPISIFINTFESEKVSIEKIYKIVESNFELSPSSLIGRLNLLMPMYLKTASYGHFGREDQDFSWEIPAKL
jgi:S-adenosylmethionine synthetase